MSDCKAINPLPQFSGTCWFNAILMCLYHSMCGRFVFQERAFEVSPVILWKELNKLKEYQHLEIKGRHSVVFKPEYIIKKLVTVNPKLFDFENYRNVGREIVNHGASVTPYYNKGVSPPHAVRSYLEYTYQKKFAFLKCFPTGKPNQFSLYNMPDLNKYCQHPGSFEDVQISKYWCLNISKERPEFLCLRRYPHLSFTTRKHNVGVFDTENPICVIDGIEYVQDSCIIYNHNLDKIKKGHVVAGITCGNERFIYNGWTSYSTDPAMMGRRMANHIPCPLYPMDWLKYNEDFCISSKTCTYPKAINQDDLCFHPRKGHAIYFLYRKDIYDAALKTSQFTQQVRNTFKEKSIKKDVVEKTQCPPEFEINPATGRCRKSCTKVQIRNIDTGRCIKATTAVKNTYTTRVKKPSPTDGKPCPPGKVRNPHTNRCRKS